jgi:hypothetical protein
VLARHSALTTKHHRKAEAECGPEDSDDDVVVEDPNDEPVPYEQTEEDLVSDDEHESEVAKPINDEFPSGRNSYKPIIKETFNVDVRSKSSFIEATNSFNGNTAVYLNDNSIYIFTSEIQLQEENYRENILAL